MDCSDGHEPDLLWSLRGAGGSQFGVVTSLRFDTVREPMTTRTEAHWSDIALEQLVSCLASLGTRRFGRARRQPQPCF